MPTQYLFVNPNVTSCCITIAAKVPIIVYRLLLSLKGFTTKRKTKMQSNKTPVSMLQEMMFKKKIIPNFELIVNDSGTHDNTFTYMVSCEGLSATGTGRCKKDAKQLAAKNLLRAIALRNNHPLLTDSTHQEFQVDLFVSDALVFNNTDVELKRPFVNAIGALQDLCSKHHLSDPIYLLISEVGPPHSRKFTIQCIVSSFEEYGEGKTKKHAKQNAAQKMLDRLCSFIDDTQAKSLNSCETCNFDTMIKEYSTMIEYLEAMKISFRKADLGIKLNDYHLALKQLLPKDTKEELLKKLNKLMSECYEEENNISEELIHQLLSRLKEYCNSLQMDLFYGIILSKGTTEYVCTINLIYGPSIQELGYGKTKAESCIMAIREFLQSVIILLS